MVFANGRTRGCSGVTLAKDVFNMYYNDKYVQYLQGAHGNE